MSIMRFAGYVLFGAALLAGCNDNTQTPTPAFEQFDVSQLDVKNGGAQSSEVLDGLIRSSGSSAKQKYNCPWWSEKCWCAGGLGSTDCSKLIGSGKCGVNDTQEVPSAKGRGKAGVCMRGDGQAPCNDYYTGACT